MAEISLRLMDSPRPTCFARSMLDRASADLARGDLIAAGCRLREAVRQFLDAMCDAHDCYPRRRRDRFPHRMICALLNKQAIDRCDKQWLGEALEIGNNLSHCRDVAPSLVATAIQLVGLVLYSAEDDVHFPEGGRA